MKERILEQKKKQFLIYTVIFLLIVFGFANNISNPNIEPFYNFVFRTSTNEGLSLFMKPFMGMFSFFIVLMESVLANIFTWIFVLLFPFLLTKQNFGYGEDNIMNKFAKSMILKLAIGTIIGVVLMSIININILYLLVSIITYIIPMYILYYVSYKLMLMYRIKKQISEENKSN